MDQCAMRKRVAVVGGGVVGCATAYELARAGFKVTLVERDVLGAHASGSNAGNLNPLFGTEPELIPSALQAFQIHNEVREHLTAMGCLLRPAMPVRRVHLGCDEADRGELEEAAVVFNAHKGFSAEWLASSELHRIEPRLSPIFSLGLLTSGALSIDGSSFTRALAEGARALGATIIYSTVTGLLSVGARVIAIRLGSEMLTCDEVVFATGPWVADIASWLGIDLPVKPVKGELLRVRIENPPSFDFTWRSAALYRRSENEVWIGGTMRNCGFDPSPTSEVRDLLMSGGIAIIPEIRNAEVLDHVAALRPVSAQGMPIAGRAGGWENVYIANGGGSKGVLLSVGIARRIRSLLVDGNRSLLQQDPVRLEQA
jgi:glycine oxidase